MTLVRADGAERATALAYDPVDDRYERATVIIARIAIVLVGFDVRLAHGAPPGLFVAVLLLPLWLPSVRRYSGALLIGALALAAVPSGLVLSELSAVDHTVHLGNQLGSVALLLSGIGAIGLLLWARTLLPLHQVVALYGAGAVACGLQQGDAVSWKFNLAVPVTFLVLGVIEGRQSRVVPAVAIIGLGLMGINDDARSYFGMCVLAAMLSLWQVRSRAGTGALSRWFPAILIAGSAAAVYFLASALLTSGYFGTELQERSVTQIETTGSLIAGGRPEWSATRELMRTNPQGYGIGVVPTWEDYIIGKKGLASINVDTGGYAIHFMFGGEFRLHSVIADLWVGYGLVGLGLGFAIAWTIVRSLSSSIADRQAANIGHLRLHAGALVPLLRALVQQLARGLSGCRAGADPRGAPRPTTAARGRGGRQGWCHGVRLRRPGLECVTRKVTTGGGRGTSVDVKDR